MVINIADGFVEVSTPESPKRESSPSSATSHIIKDFGSFADFVRTHILGTIRRQRSLNREKRPADIDVIDFARVEEDYDETWNISSTCSRRKHISGATLRGLKSPRAVLSSMVPSVATQLMRMDVLLLHECPMREELSKAAWKGCSAKNRAQVWRMLLGYEPLNFADRKPILETKRREYREYVSLLHAPQTAVDMDGQGEIEDEAVVVIRDRRPSGGNEATDGKDKGMLPDEEGGVRYTEFSAKILRQIEMDLPRTHPDVPIFHVDEVRNPMRRILYLFGMLHPNKNYVQGMNELISPILAVFLSDHLKETKEKGIENFLTREQLSGGVTQRKLDDAEADAFWTFSLFVSCIEDNFTFGQPGIFRRVARLQEIVRRVDPRLAEHLESNGNEFIQFSLRWMNCMLMRELPFHLVVKLWDVFVAEIDGLSDLHVYVCAAMIIRFRGDLLSMDFEDCIMFLQNLPTNEWETEDVDILLCQAQLWKKSLLLTSLAQS